VRGDVLRVGAIGKAIGEGGVAHGVLWRGDGGGKRTGRGGVGWHPF
jgi:hypothetical protein